jgi:hypothetical protein
MDPQIQTKLHELETKVDAIWQSVEKTRKYFQITMWASIILFVLPLFLAAFAIPTAMSSYMDALNSSGLQDLQGL